MIDLVWNFPLLPEQGEQWRGYLRRALEKMHPQDARELRPSFRGCDATLRERAAKWLGTPVERTWLSVGGHHGTLMSMMAAGMSGKTMAVEEITYTAALDQSRMLGSSVVSVAFDSEGMLPDALRARCLAGKVDAVFVMPSVHNPLGYVASFERREAIVAVAREFGLWMIEDDAYGYMAPHAPPSYAKLAPERVFYVRGMSKSYAPAAGTGFLVVPESVVGLMENVLKHTTTGSSLLHNTATLDLIEDGTLDAVIAAKLAEGARRNKAARAVLGSAATPGAECAWHLWVSLPGGMTSGTAQRACAERGVMVSGAPGFTAPGVEVPRALRIGLGGEVEAERIEEGVRVVAEVIEGQMRNK